MRFSFSCNFNRAYLLFQIKMDFVDLAMRGLLIGILVGLIIFYVLRPREPYPLWALKPFEQPWMILIVLLVIITAFTWDITVGILLSVFVIGIAMDVMVYGKHYVPKNASSPLRTQAEKPSLTLESGIATPVSVISGLPLSKTDIQEDLPTPQYPMFAGTQGPQPGDPQLF